MQHFSLVSRWVTYMSTKSHIHEKSGALRKKLFSKSGMPKFTYKGYFLTIKKACKKLLYWKSKWWAHALVRLLYTRFIFLKKTKISIFGGILEFLMLIVIGQILAIFGNFGQIQLPWQWLIACLHLKGKTKKTS